MHRTLTPSVNSDRFRRSEHSLKLDNGMNLESKGEGIGHWDKNQGEEPAKGLKFERKTFNLPLLPPTLPICQTVTV